MKRLAHDKRYTEKFITHLIISTTVNSKAQLGRQLSALAEQQKKHRGREK